METQIIVNFLNDSNNENSKFARKKWHIINSGIKGNYLHNIEIKFLKSSLLLLRVVMQIQKLHLKIEPHLKNAEKKEMNFLLIMHNILILQCLCTT